MARVKCKQMGVAPAAVVNGLAAEREHLTQSDRVCGRAHYGELTTVGVPPDRKKKSTIR